MDWERVLINTGLVFGFFMLITFWVGLAMWMRVDADKRGIVGWVWTFIGIVTGPLGLIVYLLYRANRPVLPVVQQRDEIIAQTSQAQAAQDYDPTTPDSKTTAAADELSPAIKAALEAEQRHLYEN